MLSTQLWHKSFGGANARLSSARVSPGIIVLEGTVPEVGIFIDESGIQEGSSRFYLVTLVIHGCATNGMSARFTSLP